MVAADEPRRQGKSAGRRWASGRSWPCRLTMSYSTALRPPAHRRPRSSRVSGSGRSWPRFNPPTSCGRAPSSVCWRAQFLAAFNDQAINASAMFFAIKTGTLSEKEAISLMMVLYYAPWAIFCTMAGWLADRYSKRNALVLWKVVEVGITLVALAGFWMGTRRPPRRRAVGGAGRRLRHGHAQHLLRAGQVRGHAGDPAAAHAVARQRRPGIAVVPGRHPRHRLRRRPVVLLRRPGVPHRPHPRRPGRARACWPAC